MSVHSQPPRLNTEKVQSEMYKEQQKYITTLESQLATQAQALKEAEERSNHWERQFENKEAQFMETRVERDSLRSQLEAAQQPPDDEAWRELVADAYDKYGRYASFRIQTITTHYNAMRRQLEAAKEDRDSAESKAASYEAMEPYATVKLLQGQLEAANRDLSLRWQQLEESSMAIEDTLHAQLGAIASAIYPEKESGFTYSVAFMVQEILELRRDRDKLENVTAELETAQQEIREWEESLKVNQRDYEDMRRFQGKFIEADQERRALKGRLETAQLERDRDEVTITAQAWELGELKTKMEATTQERDAKLQVMRWCLNLDVTPQMIRSHLRRAVADSDIPDAEPTCSECEKRLQKLRSEIADLLQRYTENAPGAGAIRHVLSIFDRNADFAMQTACSEHVGSLDFVRAELDRSRETLMTAVRLKLKAQEEYAYLREECGRLIAALRVARHHIKKWCFGLGEDDINDRWNDSPLRVQIDAALASKPKKA